MDVPRLITIVLPIAAVHFAVREALFERAKLRPDSAIFPTILTFRFFFAIGPLMLLYGAVQVARGAQARFDYFLAALMIGFAIMMFSLDQGTISVTEEGVFFRRWCGLRKNDIAWKDVRSAVSSAALRTITVFSRDGQRIVHAQFHVAPLTLEAVLMRRLGGNFIRQ